MKTSWKKVLLYIVRLVELLLSKHSIAFTFLKIKKMSF